ncbi:MAG TPA: serine/threonine-protein kinase [Pyrinomonadaceae bacterium]|nr:serine/threonine-protein kinase [Pyrinomonadaceae bacterium]
MLESDPYIGQVLDEKYQLERLLGRGGMGAVYLATHLGTERYVALKLITPQFMRNEEFVARFKREARAAGRLRHPNVVDVTDFGFAHAGKEAVAYLVMEYLDGCTLADVLVEEKRLPLEWVVDILEQVCSAVHEAHLQGVVHRDLKPENIWLEPNRLGGYRVKVLDFGIAKLAEVDAEITDGLGETNTVSAHPATPAAIIDGVAATSFKAAQLTTLTPEREHIGDSHDLEIDTLIYSADASEKVHTELNAAGATAAQLVKDGKTQVFKESVDADAKSTALLRRSTDSPEDDDRTLLFGKDTQRAMLDQHTGLRTSSAEGAQLTRIGAIMGTPLYMSPEQCAGKPLDARSDIYSLGVIAYQMLAGETPFAGVTGNVMQEHIKTAPPPLRARNKKVRKRAAEIVMTALSKQPEDRPQTAAAFASSLRAQAEGIGSLYRRALSLYVQYFPKFLKLSLIAHIPVFITTVLLIIFELAENAQPSGFSVGKVLIICGLVIAGLLHIAANFLTATTISGMTAVIVTQLSLAPLRPVELRLALAVLKRRWRPFLKTSFLVTLRIIIGLILFVIPGIVIAIRYALYAPVVLLEGLETKAARQRARALGARSWRTIIIVLVLQFLIPLIISALFGRLAAFKNTEGGIHVAHQSMSSQIYQQLTSLINIFVVPLTSIVPALLYLKMRQLGGENLTDVLTQIEDADETRGQWQQRMRTRVSFHSSRGSGEGSRQSAERKEPEGQGHA